MPDEKGAPETEPNADEDAPLTDDQVEALAADILNDEFEPDEEEEDKGVIVRDGVEYQKVARDEMVVRRRGDDYPAHAYIVKR